MATPPKTKPPVVRIPEDCMTHVQEIAARGGAALGIPDVMLSPTMIYHLAAKAGLEQMRRRLVGSEVDM